MTRVGTVAPEQQETRILETVRRFWGFDRLWPRQREAIQAGLERRDSMVVMPTGGGKSLCYQVPPILQQRTDIVVSPLISLMKDQVDGLRACGYPAEAIHSNLDASEKRVIFDRLNAGEVRLLFVSPERLITSSFMDLVNRLGVTAFATLDLGFLNALVTVTAVMMTVVNGFVISVVNGGHWLRMAYGYAQMTLITGAMMALLPGFATSMFATITENSG